MRSFLMGPVTVRIAGRLVLRAAPVRRGSQLLLVESDGTEISLKTPVAALLDRSDLIAALAPDGAIIETFQERTAWFRLRLRRTRGGAELIIETPDGLELDAHQAPILAVLPRLLSVGSGPRRGDVAP